MSFSSFRSCATWNHPANPLIANNLRSILYILYYLRFRRTIFFLPPRALTILYYTLFAADLFTNLEIFYVHSVKFRHF